MAEQLAAQGDRSVVVGRDVINSIINAGDHNRFFIGDYERLRDAYIEPWSVFERVNLDHFVGREWLLAEMDAFLRDHDRGYFILEAEAGLGKTTFLAWLVRERGYIHHFIDLKPGLDGIGRGLKNLAAQIVLTYHLSSYEAEGVLHSAAARPDYLSRLLNQAAGQRRDGEKIVLVVDALDEAGTPPGQNVMGLPQVLPEGVFIIVSQRPVPVTLQVDIATTPRRPFRLAADSNENQADMHHFLERVAAWPGVSHALQESGYSSEQFTATLLQKCQGVWIYMHYVVHEIERGERSPLDLAALPDGVTQYYTRNWGRWRDEDEDRWYAVYLPLLSTLAAAQEAVSAGRLAEWADVKIPSQRLHRLLNERWRPFLAIMGQGRQARYRFYHTTLHEFFDGRVEKLRLTEAESSLVVELAEATQEAHNRIANHYLGLWGGLELNLPSLQEPDLRVANGGYGLRYLVTHLDAAGRTKDIHRLLVLEIPSKTANLWHTAKGSAEDVASYLADVYIAWRRADEAGAKMLGLQIRYALIESSIHTLAGNVPKELLVLLVKYGVWTPEQAFGYVQQIEEHKREDILKDLPPALGEGGRLKEALAFARTIKREYYRADALAGVVPYLSDEQQDEVLDEILQVLQNIEAEEPKCRIVHKLAPYLRSSLMRREDKEEIESKGRYIDVIENIAAHYSDAESYETLIRTFEDYLARLAPHAHEEVSVDFLAMIDQIEGELTRARVLSVIAPYLPVQQLAQALSIAQQIEDEGACAQALAGLAPRLPAGLLTKAIHSAKEIHEESAWAYALMTLAKGLPDGQKRQILIQIFDVGQQEWRWFREESAETLAELAVMMAQVGLYEQAIQAAKQASIRNRGVSFSIGILAKMMPYLPPGEQLNVLAIVQEFQHERNIAYALKELVQYISPSLLPELLTLAREIQYKETRARALASLVPYLSAKERQSVLDEVLTLAQETGFIYPLIDLSEHMPDGQRCELLIRSLNIVRQIGDANARVSMLIALGPHLPPTWMKELLVLTTEVEDIQDQIQGMLNLLPKLPDQQRQEVILSALEMIEAGGSQGSLALALADLMPYLTSPLLNRAVEIAQGLPITGTYQDFPRAEAVAALAPLLSAKRRSTVVAQALSEVRQYPAALAKLAPYLSDEQRAEFLSMVQGIQNEYERAEALAQLAPHFLPSQILTALEIAQALPEYETVPGQIVQRVFGDEVITNILVAPDSPDQFARTGRCPRACALVGLVPYLPAELRDEWIPKAIDMVQQLDNVQDQVGALVNLAHHLPPQQKRRLLDATLSVVQEHQDGESDRGSALSILASQLSARDDPALLLRALETALSVRFEASTQTEQPRVLSKEDAVRPRALAALAVPWHEWIQNDLSQAYAPWPKTLRSLAIRHRALLLGDLQALVPIIIALGGEEAAVETAKAIQDAGRWWP